MFPAVIAQNFIPTAELAIPTGATTNEANAEIETQSLTIEMKIRNVQSNLKPCATFYAFHPLNHYFLFHLKDTFSFHLFLLVLS